MAFLRGTLAKHPCKQDTLVGHSDVILRQVSKTSVSRKTSSKSHTSKSKASISYETSSTSQAGRPIGANTSSSPDKQFCDSSPFKPHPPTPQSQCHKVLPPPRNVTSATPRNLTIPCACHENRTFQNLHKVLRLPRKVTISRHVQQNLHLTDTFRARAQQPKSSF